MKFGITQETNLIQGKIQIINDLSSLLEIFFQNKMYGNNVDGLLVGIVCVKPEFESFFKVRKLKYSKDQTLKNNIDKNVEVMRLLSFDIKLEYEHFNIISDDLFKEALKKKLINSMKILENLQKKSMAFDQERFRFDMEGYLLSC